MIRKEAWPFRAKKSGVRLCWDLEEPSGPKEPVPVSAYVGSSKNLKDLKDSLFVLLILFGCLFG